MKKNLTFFCILLFANCWSQNFPGQRDFQWPDYFVNYMDVPDSLKDEEAIILNEQLVITDNIIRKRIAIKIQNERGLERLRQLQLPENFDLTNPPNWYSQGRFKGRRDPFIYSYKINYFSARILKPNKKFEEITVKCKSEKVYWVDTTGRRIYDYIHDFNFEDLSVGDILEYTYEALVDWNHAQHVVYPNGIDPKFNYSLDLKVGIRADLKNIELIYDYKIPKNVIKKTVTNKNGDLVRNANYSFDYLKGYNSIENIRPGYTLPSISVNHGSFYALKGSGNPNVYTMYALDRYKWMLIVDTVKTNLYDKYHANVRKFIAGFESISDDTTGVFFASQLVDTLNKLKFVSAESMSYGDIPQYALPSSEQLLKGRLTEEFIFKNYRDFLTEKNIFYYSGIMLDKRKGIINMDYRNAYDLEKKIIVIPIGNSFKYYVPRYRGVTYLPDELPFYLEGTKCALMPCSRCAGSSSKLQISFITIPKSNFNENARSESASIKVITDSMRINVFIKENLSGQFSTMLRHYYNNEYIDSTVRESFYKKCYDIPGLSDLVIKKGALQNKFPFRQTYNCSGNIKLNNKGEISLKDWFSFTWSKTQFSKTPNHEIYTEFQQSDYYNLLFEFDKPVEVVNLDDFAKKMMNEYFEITSNLVKQDGNKYLLSVIVKVKQDMVPEKDAVRIMDFVSVLDVINNFKIQYKTL